MKQSALHIAARYGHVECLEFVLQRIPHENRIKAVNSKNRLSGATPLHCCLQKNNAAVVVESGKKKISQESLSRRMATVRLLIQAGANLEAQDAAGKTPLDYWKENFEYTSSDDDEVASHVHFLGEELRSKVKV
jgi:ankyrin repeat protein